MTTEVIEAIRPYRPSNGTEGEIFHEAFCYRCAKYGDPDGPIFPCRIQGAALGLSIDDPNYPRQWIEDRKGPRCSAFEPEGGKAA